MESFYRLTLFAAGLINLLPSVLVFLPDRISKSYGVEMPSASYELLLRHRAVLFGIIGGLMIASAISKKYYAVATIAGMASMASFIVLYFWIGKDISAELKRVMLIDVLATVLLLAGFLGFLLRARSIRQ